MSDCFRHVRAVDTVDRAAEIDGAGAERIAFSARHPARQIGLARDHFRRGRPIRPLRLACYGLNARPPEAISADADAVADRTAITEDEVEMGLRNIDDDSASNGLRWVIDHLASQVRPESRDRPSVRSLPAQ